MWLIWSCYVALMLHAFFYFQEKRQGARGDTLVCGACDQVGTVKPTFTCALLEMSLHV
jgi:hypothetical protein